MEKRGQNLSITTIIIIILGIVVLVFLIFGFSTGWGNFWDRVTNLGGGKSNIDSISHACSLACSSNSEYSYCNENRELRVDNEKTMGSCRIFSLGGYIENCGQIKCEVTKTTEMSGSAEW